MVRRALAVIAVAATATLSTSTAAHAQLRLGPELAWNDDADLGVGVGLEVGLPSLHPAVAFMGDFIWFFPGGDVDYFEFNGNLTWDIPLEETAVVPFALAGLNVATVDTNGGGDTDVGLNLGGGLKFNMGSFRPRLAGRFAVGNDSFTLFFFLPFTVAN